MENKKEKKRFRISRRDIIIIFITSVVTAIIILVILFIMINKMRPEVPTTSSSEATSSSEPSYIDEKKIDNNLLTIINNYYDEYPSIYYHANKIVNLNYDESNLYVGNISEDNIFYNIVTISLEGEVDIIEALTIIKDNPRYLASGHISKKISKSINIELSNEYKAIYPGSSKGINYQIVDNIYGYDGININNDMIASISTVIYDNSTNNIDTSNIIYNEIGDKSSLYHSYLSYLYTR